MTARQREVLAAMVPGKAETAGAIASRGSLNHRTIGSLLRRLEAGGYVSCDTFGAWRLTPAGHRVWQRAALPLVSKALVRKGPVKPKRKPRRRSFSERYKDPNGPRYGQLFLIVRVLACWLKVEGYPGHECGPGAQGGHTAHHVGRYDRDGLIPGCGRAHDLYAGLGGRTEQEEFKAWLREGGVTLKEIGFAYVVKANDIVKRGDYGKEDMAT